MNKTQIVYFQIPQMREVGEFTYDFDLGTLPRVGTVILIFQGSVGMIRGLDFDVLGTVVRIYNVVAGDSICIIYEEQHTVTCTYTLTGEIDNNVYLTKQFLINADVPQPIATDAWTLQVDGGPEQNIFYSVEDFEILDNPLRVSWAGKSFESAVQRSLVSGPNVNPILHASYPVDGSAGKVGEVRCLTANEASWKRIYLRHIPFGYYSSFLYVRGGCPQLKDVDYRFDTEPGTYNSTGRWLAWDGMALDGQLVAGDYVYIIYHTKVLGLPAKAPIELANKNQKGLSPRLLGEVRPFGAVTENVEPSEFAIRTALDEFTPALTYATAPGVSVFSTASSDLTQHSLVKRDGDYTFTNISDPLERAPRTVTYDYHAQKAYFRGITTSGDYTWIGDSTGVLSGTVVICTSAETEIIPDDPKFIKSPAAGGIEMWAGAVPESGTFASGTLLFSAPSGTLIGGVRFRTLSGFTTASDIYSIGTDHNRELITRKFRAPMNYGDFLSWEPGQTLARDGFTHFSTAEDVKLYCYTSAREIRPLTARMLDTGVLGVSLTYDIIDWEDSARCYVAAAGWITEFNYGVGGMNYVTTLAPTCPGASGGVAVSDKTKSNIYFFNGVYAGGGYNPGSTYAEYVPQLYKWNAPTRTGAVVQNYSVSTFPYRYYGGAASALGAAWFFGGKDNDTTHNEAMSGNIAYFKFADSTFTMYNAGMTLSGAADFGCGLVNESMVMIFGGSRQTIDDDINSKSASSTKTLAFDCVTKTAMDSAVTSPSRAGLRAASFNHNKVIIAGGYESGMALSTSSETLIGQPSRKAEFYNDSTSILTSLPDMPYGTSRSALFATNNKVHVVGGETYMNADFTVNKTGAAMTMKFETKTWEVNNVRSSSFAGLGYSQLD